MCLRKNARKFSSTRGILVAFLTFLGVSQQLLRVLLSRSCAGGILRVFLLLPPRDRFCNKIHRNEFIDRGQPLCLFRGTQYAASREKLGKFDLSNNVPHLLPGRRYGPIVGGEASGRESGY